MSPQMFRDKYIWCEPVDNILKAYKEFFKAIYDKIASSKDPSKPVSMDMEDLEKLFVEVEDLFTEGGLAQRDLSLFFSQSMMTQVNEIDSDRHLSMTFIEFLEAVVRAIYKSSPAPIIRPETPKVKDDSNSGSDSEIPDEVAKPMTIEERKA